MLYRNMVNGSIIDSKAVISGKNWEPLENQTEEKKEPKETKKKKNAKQ